MEIPPPPVLLERVRGLPATAALLARLADSGPLYVVGGAVRDVVLGGAPVDLDLVVEGDAAALAAQIADAAPPRVHDRFGTSTVMLGPFTYDIARARSERYLHPGALPQVRPATIEEDLARRDFTVNAIAIGIAGPDSGTVHASPHAFDDLRAEQLRVLHPRSFIDDPTRLFRLVRYASRLGFVVEPETLRLTQAAVQGAAPRTLTGPRIGAELRLLAREPDPVRAFTQLRELGLDDAVEPGFGLADPGLAARGLALLPDDGRPDLLVLAAAGAALPATALRRLLDRLGFEAADRDVVVAAATRAEPIARALAAARSPSGIAAAVGAAPPEAVALAGARGAAEPARLWLERLRHVTVGIGGDDLLAAGVPRGPAIGRGLRAALAAKLDGRADGREAELREALRAARGSG